MRNANDSSTASAKPAYRNDAASSAKITYWLVIRTGALINDLSLSTAVRNDAVYFRFGLFAGNGASEADFGFGSCVTSTAGPNGGAQLYER